MEYTKDPAKMIIFFDDSKETVYGEIVFNDWNDPVEFVTDRGITFTIVKSEELFMDRYECEVTLDKENLNKLRKQYPKLYEKISDYVKKEFYLLIIDDAIKYVKEDYPDVIGKEFEDLVDKVIEELLQDYDFENRGVEDMINYVPLITTIVRQ
jgi:hypothetical protein